jgi:hypothetical protein
LQVASGLASEREVSFIREASGSAVVSQLDVFRYDTAETIRSHLMQPLIRNSRKAHCRHITVKGCFDTTKAMIIDRKDEEKARPEHRMHVVFNTCSGNVCPGRATLIRDMRNEAAWQFPFFAIGDVVVGKDPDRISKVATFTQPMTWNLMRATTAHLCSAAVTGDDDALNAGATRWGTALAEGLDLILQQIKGQVGFVRLKCRCTSPQLAGKP